MKSSIHISSEKIEVLGYKKRGKKIKVLRYVAVGLQEGAMMNGRIIDDSILVESLKELRDREPRLFSNPVLIVDGNSILQKRVATPKKLTKWQYDQVARDEFADTTIPAGNLVCDFHPIGPVKDMQSGMLAYAVDKIQVESYISTFKAAGIKLRSVRLGVAAIIEYVGSNPELQNSTFVINVVDGVALLSMLFENGVNVFISRTRLYSENHEQFLHDIVGNLSGLIQFNKSEKFNEITTSYYLGLDEGVVRDLDAVMPYPEISVKPLDLFGGAVMRDGPLPADAHFAFLGARLDGGIDLIESLSRLSKYGKRQRPKNFWIPAVAVIVAALAVPIVYLHLQITEMNALIDGVNRFIQNEGVQQKSAEIEALLADTAFHNDIANQLNSKIEHEQGLAQISRQALDLITRTHSDVVTITVIDFNEAGGVIRVSGSSETESDSAMYTGAVKSNPLVADIRYTGYSYGNEGEYNFSLDVILAGREDDQ